MRSLELCLIITGLLLGGCGNKSACPVDRVDLAMLLARMTNAACRLAQILISARTHGPSRLCTMYVVICKCSCYLASGKYGGCTCIVIYNGIATKIYL